MSSEELCQQWKSHSRLAKVDLMLFRFKKEKSKIRIAWGNQNLAEFWQNCFSGLSALESCELQERIQSSLDWKAVELWIPPLVAPVAAPAPGLHTNVPGLPGLTQLSRESSGKEQRDGAAAVESLTAGPCKALRLQLLKQESRVTCLQLVTLHPSHPHTLSLSGRS